MAALVETMAYTTSGGVPWHRDGVAVTDDMTPAEMQTAAGCDWALTKEPIFAHLANGRIVPIDNRFGLTRSTDGTVYDIVSDLYTPVQPTEAFDFFKRFVTAGDMTMETAGSLSGGKRIWALAKIGKGFTLKGGDRVEGYLLLCSPNELGKSLVIKFVTIRVVCHNTLTAALRGKAGFTMAHWHKFDENMQEVAAKALNIASQRLSEFTDAAGMLAATPAGEQQVYQYVARVIQPDLLAKTTEATPVTAPVVKAGGSIIDAMMDQGGGILDSVLANTEATGRTLQFDDFNRAGKTVLNAILDSPGSDLSSAKGTWWGTLNGVTHAIDHTLGRDNTRLDQAWFGHREAQKTKALEYAIQYAEQAAN